MSDDIEYAPLTALQDYIDTKPSRGMASDSQIAAAGTLLRKTLSELDSEKAQQGISGAEVDPVTGLGGLAEGTAAEPFEADRIERGESLVRPEAEIVESPDADRAAGTHVTGATELFDS